MHHLPGSLIVLERGDEPLVGELFMYYPELDRLGLTLETGITLFFDLCDHRVRSATSVESEAFSCAREGI